MPRRPSAFLGILAALTLLLAALPLPSLAATVTLHTRQAEGDSYESPEFGYVVKWNGDWAARERDFTSDPDFGDSMTLSNNAGRVRIVGVEANISPAEALDNAVSNLTNDTAVVEPIADNASAAVPSREFLTGQNHALVEIHEVDGALVAVSLFTRQRTWDDALSLAQSGITLNGTTIFSGEAATSQRAETPADAEPVDSPAASPVADVPGDVWTSQGFDYTVTIPAAWAIEQEDDDTLALSNGTSLVTVTGQAAESDDLATCVSTAATAFGEAEDADDFRIFTTPTGERFQGSDARSAFALFSYTTGDDEWAYFVRCSHIEEGESVLIVTQQVPMASYTAERGARRQIETAVTLP